MILLPYGHERQTVQRLPIITPILTDAASHPTELGERSRQPIAHKHRHGVAELGGDIEIGAVQTQRQRAGFATSESEGPLSRRKSPPVTGIVG